MRLPQILFLFLFLPFNLLLAQKEEWKLSKQADNISVFTRNVAQTNFKEVRSVTKMPIAASDLLELVNDYSSIQPWRYKVKEMKLLDGDPMGAHYLYFVLNLPIPLSDRDFVLQIETERKSDGRILINFDAVSDQLPAQEGKVRMNKMEGFWELKPLASNITEVTYQYLSDPAGVPAWIVNLFTVNAPFQALSGLRASVEKN